MGPRLKAKASSKRGSELAVCSSTTIDERREMGVLGPIFGHYGVNRAASVRPLYTQNYMEVRILTRALLPQRGTSSSTGRCLKDGKLRSNCCTTPIT